MGKPVICPECQRIVVLNPASQACPDCGGQASADFATPSQLAAPGNSKSVTRKSVKRTPMSEDLQWSLIMIGIGIIFIAWSIISPETSIRKKWSSGPGTPVSWIGGFSLGVGVIWAFCLTFLSGKSE